MLIIPSLDLPADSGRDFARSAATAIQDWERAGFTRVQLVAESSPNQPNQDFRVVEEVLRDAHCPIQVAGRFETTEEIDDAISAGAGLIVLSGRAIDELDWLASVSGRFPGQLLLATPARERRSRTRGALRTLPLDLRDLAAEVASLPLAGIVVEFPADIAVGHAELALLEDVAEEVDFAIQVSGTSPDLGTLRDIEFRGVSGVVIAAAHLSAAFDGQTLARDFDD
jgi:phosphoribosylformimino-5-aminoimidazole carboxamide ribonucleotide (ProFAR) isomerase